MFSVLLPVYIGLCITSSNFKNEDTAKSDCFCDFYVLLHLLISSAKFVFILL